jgi:biotin operon repressor
MDERQRHVLAAVERARGRSHAVTATHLAAVTRLSTRSVRAVVAELRRQGYPIASAVQPPYGFYVPATPEEAQECQAQLYSRIRELGITARALDRAFGQHVPGRQMVLDLFGGESA